VALAGQVRPLLHRPCPHRCRGRGGGAELRPVPREGT